MTQLIRSALRRPIKQPIRRSIGSAPDLRLLFTDTSRALDPHITFTRTTQATYFDSTGTLQTAASGVARANQYADHNPSTLSCLGFLIEEQRTNSCIYSETDSEWTLANCSTDGTWTSPKGVATPVFLASGAAASHRISETVSGTIAGTTVVTYGWFVYIPSGSDVIRLFLRGRSNLSATGQAVVVVVSGTGASATFTFSGSSPFGTDAPAAVTASSLFVQNCGNGVFRISVASTTSTDAAKLVNSMDISFSNNAVEATAGTANTRCGIWGFTCEAGAFPTSYIPTTTASATRNADVAVISGSAFSSFYNQTQGTFVVRASSMDFAASRGLFAVGDPTLAFGAADTMYAVFNGSLSGRITANVLDGGVPQVTALGTVTAVSVNTAYKAAFAYKLDDFAESTSGATAATDTNGTVPTPTALSLGGLSSGWSGGASSLNGHLSSLSYYRTRLTPNETLQALSA